MATPKNDKKEKNKENKNKKNKKITKQNTIEIEKKETQKFLKEIKEKNKELFNDEQKLNFSEFYDLPFRYNETIVRLLSQSPKKLFVYWDINDKTKEELKENYGKDFFDKTTPVLIVENKSNGKIFEVEVNDFANSWYIDIPDENSTYEIELGRKFKQDTKINKEKFAKNDLVFITSSNIYTSSDEHINFTNSEYILFEDIIANKKYYLQNTIEQKQKTAKIYEISGDIENIKNFTLDQLVGSSNNFNK